MCNSKNMAPGETGAFFGLKRCPGARCNGEGGLEIPQQEPGAFRAGNAPCYSLPDQIHLVFPVSCQFS